MIDLKFLRQNPELVRTALAARSGRHLPALDALLALDAEARAVALDIEPLRARRQQGRRRHRPHKTGEG